MEGFRILKKKFYFGGNIFQVNEKQLVKVEKKHEKNLNEQDFESEYGQFLNLPIILDQPGTIQICPIAKWCQTFCSIAAN